MRNSCCHHRVSLKSLQNLTYKYIIFLNFFVSSLKQYWKRERCYNETPNVKNVSIIIVVHTVNCSGKFKMDSRNGLGRPRPLTSIVTFSVSVLVSVGLTQQIPSHTILNFSVRRKNNNVYVSLLKAVLIESQKMTAVFNIIFQQEGISVECQPPSGR